MSRSIGHRISRRFANGNTGRVAPDDYVYHPIFQKWIYLSEVRELGETTVIKSRRPSRSMCGVAVAFLLLAFMFGMWRATSIGALFSIVGVIAGIIGVVMYATNK